MTPSGISKVGSHLVKISNPASGPITISHIPVLSRGPVMTPGKKRVYLPDSCGNYPFLWNILHIIRPLGILFAFATSSHEWPVATGWRWGFLSFFFTNHFPRHWEARRHFCFSYFDPISTRSRAKIIVLSFFQSFINRFFSGIEWWIRTHDLVILWSGVLSAIPSWDQGLSSTNTLCAVQYSKISINFSYVKVHS